MIYDPDFGVRQLQCPLLYGKTHTVMVTLYEKVDSDIFPQYSEVQYQHETW